MKTLLLALLSIFLFETAKAESLTVISYNMGQLKPGELVDLVACPEERLPRQLHAMFGASSPLYTTKNFVIFIQEAWRQKAFEGIQAIAQRHGFQMFPRQFSEAKHNGQIIVTNIPATAALFIPFRMDGHAKRGLRALSLPLGSKRLAVIDVHTGYSDSRGFTKEQRSNIEDIRHFVQTSGSRHDYFIVGGDFNAGPNLTYKKQHYDVSKVVWRQNVLPLMHEAGLHLASQVSRNTWDDDHNALVNNATLPIKVLNGVTYGTWSWEENSSVLDNVFVSQGIQTRASAVVFDQKEVFSCPGREDERGGVHLSDHYGTMSVLELP